MGSGSQKNTRKYKRALKAPVNRLMTAIFSEDTSQTIKLVKEYPEIKSFAVLSLLIDAKNDDHPHEYTTTMLNHLVDIDFAWKDFHEVLIENGYTEIRGVEMLKILHNIIDSEECLGNIEKHIWLWSM